MSIEPLSRLKFIRTADLQPGDDGYRFAWSRVVPEDNTMFICRDTPPKEMAKITAVAVLLFPAIEPAFRFCAQNPLPEVLAVLQ